jgi:hypothetical protein
LPCPVALERSIFGRLEELLEQGAVVLDRLTQVLRRCLPFFVLLSDAVCRPVALDHLWMVDRDVSGPSLEVVHRVAAVTHHGTDQVIRARDGAGWVVDERLLHLHPRLEVAFARARRERADLQPLVPLDA